MATRVILKLKQGEALPISMKIKQDGEALDLTGYTIRLQVKDAPYVNVEPIFEKVITEESDINTVGQITSAGSGQFQVMFTEEDTSYPTAEYSLVIFLDNGTTKDIISSNCCCGGQYIICPQ